MKKLTIIIPCFNMEKYLEKALSSIYNQKDQELFCDVLIVDDGSKDQSVELTKQFIKKNNIKNFKLIEKTNGNWGSVINYVKNKIEIKSEYVTILDADDYYHLDLFSNIEKIMNFNFDLIFTGFYEIKKNRIVKGYLTPQIKGGLMDKKYMYFPSLIPLCKFFKTSIFKQINDLEENVSYQDIILWNEFVEKAKTFYYIKKQFGYYLNNREGASSTQSFDEKRIGLIMKNIEKLLSNNIYQNGYLMALLMHLKKNASKDMRKYIKFKKNNYKQIKKFKLLWCPFGTRMLTKIGMLIYLNKLLRKGSL
ncbi:MAG: glycosyltransferase family 2 protein [Mycoplasmataceae bacterium]|nr:glycosyltransferase family 2 protein [Mycoplasmataceae bacterium]